jgi:hypothetical protein
LQVPVAQGCTNVALRLPGVVILSEAQALIFLENEKTKAETKKIEAEKMESLENKAERAHVWNKKQLDYELQKMEKEQDGLDRQAKREQKALDKEAERKRKMTEIEKQHELDKMEKQWELENRDATFPLKVNQKKAPAKKSKTIKSKVGVVSSIHKKSKTRKPLTDEQRENYNRKKRERNALAKAAKHNMPTSSKAAA